jgi:predicted alpha/beta hydrolase
MKIEKIQIPARDGYMLSANLYIPMEVSKGFVQIHCGTGIPQKVYSNFASFLAENGFTSLTFDYRGIAESAPRFLKDSDAKISDWGRLDMSGVFDWVLSNFPNQKKIIAAHSMGGQMVGLMDNHKKIDQLFFIASSTGYWRDMSSPYKWMPAFYWYFMIPIHTKLFGYVNAMKVKQGENLPKGVALEWRKWCTNPDYFEPEFGKTLNPVFFDQITTPIKSIQIQDDPEKQIYPMGLPGAQSQVEAATGHDAVYLGRLRKDPSCDFGLNFWIVSDNLRKGAALNAVQIGEMLARSSR